MVLFLFGVIVGFLVGILTERLYNTTPPPQA